MFVVWVCHCLPRVRKIGMVNVVVESDLAVEKHIIIMGGAKIRAHNLRPPHSYSIHGEVGYCSREDDASYVYPHSYSIYGGAGYCSREGT